MRRPLGLSCACVLVVGLTGCGETTMQSGGSDGEATYAEAMDAICAETESLLDELPEPPDEISVADFADEVARILGAEADAARALDAPDGLEADHRAFVANTDEQAAGWAVVAQGGDDALGDQTTRIAELTLGRDDLAGVMGIPECARRT